MLTLKVHCDSFCIAGPVGKRVAVPMWAEIDKSCLDEKAGFQSIPVEIREDENHPPIGRGWAAMGALLAR